MIQEYFDTISDDILCMALYESVEYDKTLKISLNSTPTLIEIQNSINRISGIKGLFSIDYTIKLVLKEIAKRWQNYIRNV